MSLFQRITTSFGEPEETAAEPMTTRNIAGEMLRERRRQLQLDLDAVAEALCIKPVYLAAIEQGRTEELPGPAYAIGFIRTYANYLGLDGERVLDSYREDKADIQTRPDLTLPVPLEERSVPGSRVLVIGVVLALCGYGTWYYVSTSQRERPERVAAVPAELQHLTASATSVPEAAPAPGTATANIPGPSAASAAQPAAAAPQFDSGALARAQSGAGALNPVGGSSASEPASAAVPGMAGPGASTGDAPGAPIDKAEAAAPTPPASPSGSIELHALADSWIQIRDADQSIVFARVLKAGETYRVPRPGLILRTGNAGALEVLVDGKPAPALGAMGALRRNVTLEPQSLLAGTAVRG